MDQYSCGGSPGTWHFYFLLTILKLFGTCLKYSVVINPCLDHDLVTILFVGKIHFYLGLWFTLKKIEIRSY